MLSMAALAQRKGWVFEYYTKPLPQRIKGAPAGNLKMALSLGMHLVEVPHERYEETVRSLRSNERSGVFVIAQGGADPLAREGVSLAAGEIRSGRTAS